MLKSELLAALTRENPAMTAQQVSQVVDIFFDTIAQTLADGGRADFRGFGVFSIRERQARVRAGRAISHRINRMDASPVNEIQQPIEPAYLT